MNIIFKYFQNKHNSEQKLKSTDDTDEGHESVSESLQVTLIITNNLKNQKANLGLSMKVISVNNDFEINNLEKKSVKLDLKKMLLY